MESNTFDVAVIGGGPAGMMAAGRAAECGARVVLIEKNPILGKKLLITGGGRCNIFNAEYDARTLTEKYGQKGKALLSSFSIFDAESSREFFESHGLPIMVEAENRAFPKSERAEDVRNTLKKYMNDHGVTVLSDSSVMHIETENGMITKIIHEFGEITAKNYVIATGGKSRPETGSTGDGFTWAKQFGHTVAENDPALVPIDLRDAWIADAAGISLTNVRLTIMQKKERIDTKTGKMLFTHTGISGPLVLNLSKRVGELLKNGEVTLLLDLFPKEDHAALDERILKHFDAGKNKLIKNNIGDIVQPRLGHALLKLANIDGDTPLYRLSREQRKAFVQVLKEVPLKVKGLQGEDKAIVTGGGVLLKEVDFKTMRSKKIANLFLAGDILDFDRPSGGFSLQICWTTGYIAGQNAI